MYYQAVCSNHNFKSSLFNRRIDAVRSAKKHRENVNGSHNIEILDVEITRKLIKSRVSIDK